MTTSTLENHLAHPKPNPKTPAPIRRWQRAQIGEYGLPLQLYVDFHSFFFTHVPAALTQLGQALHFYGIKLRYAPTPQAKGKVEREHQYWQNRLPAFNGMAHLQ